MERVLSNWQGERPRVTYCLLMSHQLSRRQLLQASAAAPLAAAQLSRANKPNILLIVSDDHPAEFTGCYGNPTIRTPNLDKCASQGMLCEEMFTAAPQCVAG